jgi:GNAT superfamily N-acetyltransferase
VRLVECAAGDLDELVALPAAVGWSDTREDWQTMLAAARVFGHRDDGGALVSCGALVDFGAVASVAKMVVRPDAQRRGLASALLAHVVAARTRADAQVTLVATAQGEPVYGRAGFREIERVHKLITPAGPAGPAGPGPAALTRGAAAARLTAAELDELVALDRAVFGADRERMLRARARQARSGVVVRAGGRVVGCGLSIAGPLDVLGPVLAPDDAVAEHIVRALAAGAPGRLRIDVPDRHRGLAERLIALGFVRVDRPAMMALEGRAAPGQRQRLFGLAAQAFG